MPRVPTYDNFQALPTVANPGKLNAPDTAAGAMVQAKEQAANGQALLQAGGVAAKLQADALEQVNQTRVTDAMSQMVRARTDLLGQALQLRGKNALERPDDKPLTQEFGDKLGELQTQIEAGLGNDAQRELFRKQATTVADQMHARLVEHTAQEFRTYRVDTLKATVDTAVDQGSLLWGDQAARTQSMGAIQAAVDERARLEGWDDKAKEVALRDAVSPLHEGVMRGMLRAGQAGEARQYYDDNSASMSLQTRARMQEVVKHASDAQTAEGTADEVWNTLGPKDANEAVRIFDMEKELRTKLKDNPEALALGLSGLRQRAQAFNAQQAESNAQGVNQVYAQLDGGKSLGEVMRSDAWLNLPNKSRHEIVKAMEAEATVREQRAAAAESRALTRMQREEKLALMRNGDKYLEYSDPQKLGTMTRSQVEALRPMFGLEATQHLLNRFDAIGKSDGKLEANIDTDTFNQVAQEMGLDPFKAKKSADEKAQLGALKYRIERLIDTAQSAKKAKLTGSEKETLVREEMARQVTVDPGFFSSNKQVPVIALTPDQAGGVVVPAAERSKIVDALKQMYAREPNNPAYAPTEQNVRRAYLRGQSKAGALINGQ